MMEGVLLVALGGMAYILYLQRRELVRTQAVVAKLGSRLNDVVLESRGHEIAIRQYKREREAALKALRQMQNLVDDQINGVKDTWISGVGVG